MYKVLVALKKPQSHYIYFIKLFLGIKIIFYSFLKKNNWDMDKIKTGNLIKRLEEIFVEEIRMTIKKQTPRLIKINTMKKVEPSTSKEPYQQENF